MADYESAPVVQEDGTIHLYGSIYRISKPVQIRLSTVLPPKQVFGDYSKDDNPTISTYTVEDLSGGPGLDRYRPGVSADLRRIRGSARADVRWPGAATMAPLFTEATKPAGVASTDAICAITSLAGTIVTMYVSGKIYNYSGSWSALIDTLPAGPCKTRPTWFNGSIYYPLGTYGYSYQSNPAAAATDVPYAAGPPVDPKAVSFVVWDSKLYCIDTGYTLYSSTTGAAGSWTALQTIELVDDVDYPRAQLVLYDDTSGNSAIWCLTHVGPYVYDSTNTKWVRSRFSFPYARVISDGPHCLGVNYRNSLVVQAGPLELYLLTMTGDKLTVEDISLDKEYGVPNTNSQIYDLTADNRYVYAHVGAGQGLTGQATYVLIYDGKEKVWYTLFDGYKGVASVGKGNISVITNSLGNRLYFSDSDDSAFTYMTNLVYIDIPQMRYHPLSSATKNYSSNSLSSSITLPLFTADYPGQQKLALQARVKLLGASSTEKIAVTYYADDASSVTLSDVTSNTETTTRLATNNVGVAFKKWRWQFNLYRGSTSTLAPKIEYVALDYLRIPDTWRGFVIEVDVSEDAPDGRTPKQQKDDLWTAIGTSTLGTFAYRDDDGGTTRAFLVKITVPEGVEGTGLNENGRYTLLLTSYGSN